MKFPQPLTLAIAWCIAAVSARANPPTHAGNSFVVLSTYWPTGGLVSGQVLYLAPNGTCELLSQCSTGWPSTISLQYSPSSSGTYTYELASGNPNEATLNLDAPGLFATAMSETLDYQSDSSGGGITLGFTFFLFSPNTFLSNASNRATLRAGDISTTGFVIEGNSARLVLIRAVGPSLANFGVSPVSNNPKLELFSSSGAALAFGQNWSLVTYSSLEPNLPPGPNGAPPIASYLSPAQFDAQAMNWIFSIAGAFPLNSNSNDQVFFGMLPPGAYTVQASDSTVGAAGGAALIELYILPFST
jgi:hypothetical protein